MPGNHDARLDQVRKPQNEKQRIHILGVGNLGRLFATSLARVPNPPPITLIVHRKTLLEQWAANPGVEISRPGGTTDRVTDFDIEWWTEEKPDQGPVSEVCDGNKLSNLIVATKAPDALPQVDRLRGYLNAESTVAFVQNGMSKLWPPHGVDYCEKRYPSSDHPNFVLCVTTHGVTSLGTFKSLHASPADVAMGPVLLNDHRPDQAECLMSRIMAASHLNARKVSRSSLWVLQLEKLVVNSVINPLTAILRCKNGVLFANPNGPIMQVMDKLIKEASRVFQALIHEQSTQELLAGADIADLHDRFSPPRLRAMLHSVGEKVKDNRSSMLQDVTAGKQTEIWEFNGWLVDTAGCLPGGLDVTSHKTIMELVEKGVVVKEEELGRYFPGVQ